MKEQPSNGLLLAVKILILLGKQKIFLLIGHDYDKWWLF